MPMSCSRTPARYHLKFIFSQLCVNCDRFDGKKNKLRFSMGSVLATENNQGAGFFFQSNPIPFQLNDVLFEEAFAQRAILHPIPPFEASFPSSFTSLGAARTKGEFLWRTLKSPLFLDLKQTVRAS